LRKVIIAQTTKSNTLNSKREADKLAARVCFYYPCYTLAEARRLPARDCNLLLDTAIKIEASKNFEMTQITAAPQTKNGSGVKKLMNHYRELVKA
jgi:hypothetical protein